MLRSLVPSFVSLRFALLTMQVDAKSSWLLIPRLLQSATFLSERESRYSQAKLELFGLFRALKDCRIWIVGVKNLVVEVDAKYIKGMINNPDVQPNANGPDGLSRRPSAPEDPDDRDDYEEWIDVANSFFYESIPSQPSSNLQGIHPVLPQWIESSNTFGIEALNALAAPEDSLYRRQHTAVPTSDRTHTPFPHMSPHPSASTPALGVDQAIPPLQFHGRTRRRRRTWN